MTADPILETKLGVPRLRRGHLPRSRLVSRLNSASGTPLLLVSAPPGSGKTTLLADWASRVDGDVAWLSIDPDDNSHRTFWTYVIAAIQAVIPEVGSSALPLLGQPPGSSPDPALTALLNDLKAVPGDLRIVFDDFHVIDSPAVQEGVAFFLAHLPPNVQLVISTRSDPALPLARLRAKGDLAEVRVADLHFTREEAAIYLTDLMGVPLTSEQVAALDERTEGWAAALQLAALSMRDGGDVAGFIADFTGSQRYVVDYLVEEVLDRQSSEVGEFLLRTSILRRLTGSLCEAVSGQPDGQARLAELERDNLLIIPLDDQRAWYRYHHLFADVLQARLRHEHPDQVPTLHVRASEWYEEAGDLSDAISHALAAGDYDRAAELVEVSVPSMRAARDEATLRRWVESLPPEVLALRPVLTVGYVGTLMAAGHTEGVEALLDAAERRLDDAEAVVTDEAELPRIPGAISLYRAALARMAGDDAQTLVHARRAFDLAPADDHLGRGGAAGFLALTNWSAGDLDAAYGSWADAMTNLAAAGHASDTLGCAISMADIRSTQGRLGEALAIYERGLATATAGPVPLRGAADMHVGIGEILRQRNDLAGARRQLAAALELGEENGLPQNLHRSKTLEARIRLAEGDIDGAVDLLAAAERVYFTDFAPDLRPVSAIKAWVLASHGRVAEAKRWVNASGLSPEDEPTYVSEFSHLALIRVLAADAQQRGEPTDPSVEGLRHRLARSATLGGRGGSLLEILVVGALLGSADGDTDSAVSALDMALGLAENEGQRRVFLDEGYALTPLLRGSTSRIARELLAEMGESVRPAGQPLVDPLTDREFEVLRLLASELSGPDIARELYVSLNTMRSHTKSIYLKLGVTSRRAAVRRALELDLLG